MYWSLNRHTSSSVAVPGGSFSSFLSRPAADGSEPPRSARASAPRGPSGANVASTAARVTAQASDLYPPRSRVGRGATPAAPGNLQNTPEIAGEPLQGHVRRLRVLLLLLRLRALADQVHCLDRERTEPGGVAEATGNADAPREMRARDVAPRLRDPTNLTGIPRASRRGFAHRRGVRRERVDRLLLGQRAPRHTSKGVEALRVPRRGSEQNVKLLVHLAAALKRQERGEAPEAHGRAGRQRVRPGARRCKLARGTPARRHARACIGLGRDSDVHQDGRQELSLIHI